MIERHQPRYLTQYLRFACILLALFSLASMISIPAETHAGNQLENLLPDELKSDPLSSSDHDKAAQLVGSIGAFEWLGPLAPIAISPFFGLACLCAISQYGGDWMQFNSFVSDNPVLQNPGVLWAFVILTLITSLPRLTKVSKPLGQAIDQLEAWSGIIAIIVIRFASAVSDPVAETTAMAAVPVLECGFFSFSADVLFSIAAVVNILVINTVKFFFEVSVWLMPFPFVDAMLEAANKSTCAILMAIYAWSPFWATVLNLLIFVACFFAFRWIKRRVTYMRSILIDPVWSMIQKSYGVPAAKELTVFPQSEIGPFAARERLQLFDTGEAWELRQNRLLLSSRVHKLNKDRLQLKIQPGLIVNKIIVEADGAEASSLLFSRRFNDHLEELAILLSMEIDEPIDRSSVSDLVMGA